MIIQHNIIIYHTLDVSAMRRVSDFVLRQTRALGAQALEEPPAAVARPVLHARGAAPVCQWADSALRVGAKRQRRNQDGAGVVMRERRLVRRASVRLCARVGAPALEPTICSM